VVKIPVEKAKIRRRDDGERDLQVIFRRSTPSLLEGVKDATKPAGTYTDTFDLHPLSCVLVEL